MWRYRAACAFSLISLKEPKVEHVLQSTTLRNMYYPMYEHGLNPWLSGDGDFWFLILTRGQSNR